MTTCGPYQLLEQIGSGNSGSVYRAIHPNNPEICVAVKILRQTPPDLWLSHLTALNQCPNPHLCRLLDCGIQADGSQYLVYPYLGRGDLESARLAFEDGRVPSRQALRWTIGALKGVAAMHQAGFLHGDIKPSCLLLGDDEQVVVCDFTTLTPFKGPLAHDLKNGTPEYLPSDDALLRTPQRDLYALGMTLVGLLTGQLPKTPEHAVPSHWDPLLPNALDRIVARALGSTEPFASAHDMRQALEGLLVAPEPPSAAGDVSLSPPTRRVDWESQQRKSPLWPWAIALLMLPMGVWARVSTQGVLGESLAPTITSSALWSGVGVKPDTYQQRLVWQVTVLGRPVLAFSASDSAGGGTPPLERARWCAAVLEEAHFQKRPLEFDYRRESEKSCEVWLVGGELPDTFFFRVTSQESELFGRKGPFLARVWCGILGDTSELVRPGSRSAERSPGSLLLEPWRRRYETLSADGGKLEQTTRVTLWMTALESLEGTARASLLDSYRDLPKESDHGS